MAPSDLTAPTASFRVPLPPPRRGERTLRVVTWVAATALAAALLCLALWPLNIGEDGPSCGSLVVEMMRPEGLCSTVSDAPGSELVVLSVVSAGALAIVVAARSRQSSRERRWRRELAATRR